MKITWFGHACFLIDSQGVRILMDPFDSSVGYKVPNVSVDVVTESHQHFDHNAHHLLRGDFQLIKEAGEYTIKNVKIRGIKTFHDEAGGVKRGVNIVFVIEFSDFRVAHLGDLGHTLNQQQVQQIGQLDVLLIPVGGTFTVGPEEAKKIVEQLQPHVAIPMHYKTKYIKFDLRPVEDFLKFFTNVKKFSESTIELGEEVKSQRIAIYVPSI
ncbi:MBL fold metallo-hydrolase [Pseudothermotoga sp.]|nr:MBL fold metallo-hydrolase [Pseudothermotoga sp.]MCX7812482.1 MBL fold metallo-hydrolase [Pseudothermotoga sp.]MDW8140064.1 MBL fold metallo-hydrolase [Pseudothermotoga sp.]